MATDNKTYMDDRQSLEALVDRLPDPVRAVYKGYGSLALESCFPGRKMVVYTLENGVPLDIKVITFGDFMCDKESGPYAKVSLDGTEFTVTTTPEKVPGRELFLHIPQNFALKYKGRHGSKVQVDFVSHYAVLVKSKSREIHQIGGHTYCVTWNQFRERFPNVPIRY